MRLIWSHVAAAIFLMFPFIAVAKPVHLRTNQQDRPLALATLNPTFSWRTETRKPGWLQRAYAITITSNNKPFWASGRVVSSDSLDIPYTGPALQFGTRYAWTVTTWDNHHLRATSAPTWFETGLKPEGWPAQWIGRDDPIEDQDLANVRWVWLPHADPFKVHGGTTADFHYTLHLDKPPSQASLHVTSRGRFIASVNGRITGTHDEWSSFDFEEITPLLRYGAGSAGDNDILLHVVSPGSPDDSAHTAIAAVIRITDSEHRERSIVTNDEWQARPNESSPWRSAQVAGPLSAPFGVAIDRYTNQPGPTRIVTTASLLRKPFTLEAAPVSARLTITALGAYRALLNGRLVAPNDILQPGFTDFSKRVLFQTYDVTALLSKGRNAIGVVLGGGWHGSPLTWSGDRYFTGHDLLRAQIDITLTDGSRKTIATDSTWKTAPSPILSAEIYGGEVYDARNSNNAWSTSAFTAADWSPAAMETVSSALKLTAQPDLLISNTLRLHPTAITPANSTHGTVFDMGQNMVGNIALHLSGPRGSVVRIRYAERLNADRSIYTANLRNATATDIYILSGNGVETYTPTFTFHGFRYVEVTGNSTPLTLTSVEGLVENSLPPNPTLVFRSSSKTLNSMNELGIWGQRGNFLSIPTDCPQRDERLGWMGDAGVFWRTGTYNFDIDSFTHKFMSDITDAQLPNGSFTDISPDLLSRAEGAPGWADAGILVPYAAWLQYGDLTLVRQSWPAMQRYMDFILQSNPDHLRQHNLGANYGDWLAPDPHTPQELIGTAYWALVARDMEIMATALRKPDDAARYAALYQAITSAYRAAYIHSDGSIVGNTQTAYAATLYAGLAPDGLISNITARLVADIEIHQDHLTTGFLGTPLLLPALAQNGHADVAYKLLLQTTYPSWGYMVDKGATTWWERWNGDTGDPSMNSYNHYAFGSVMAWVFKSVAGIDTDPTGSGFHHIIIHPYRNAAIPQVRSRYDSAYGPVITEWNASLSRFTVATPPNTTATITLPDGTVHEVLSGSHNYIVHKR